MRFVLRNAGVPAGWPAGVLACARRGRRDANRWTPVSLSWRRRRKPLATARVFRTVIPPPATRALFAPQFHLHFHAAALSERPRRVEFLSRHSAVVRESQQRSAISRHSTTTTHATHARSTDRSFTTRIESGAVINAPVVSRPARPQPMRVRIEKSVFDRRVYLFEHQATHSKSQTIARAEHTMRTASTFRRELRVVRERLDSVVAHRTTREQTETTRVRVVQPPELVYRSAPRSDAQTEVVSEQPVAPRRLVAVPQESARPSFKAADFDSSLLDRLTEDVIRRVERRVRIERERRGL